MDFNCNAYPLERTQLDVFASLVWILIMQEPGFQKTCGFADLLN
jgi:hypothetical protein